MAEQQLTAERLHEVLCYYPRTGAFRWRVSRGPVAAGSLAGTTNHAGYIVISIDGHRYMAHRLAWFYVYGEWPADEIDHRYGVRNDNRLTKLRPATHAQNGQNRHKAYANNRSGFMGVSKLGGRWRATIKVDDKQKSLGYFGTAEEAHAAYLSAKALHHEYQTLVEGNA